MVVIMRSLFPERGLCRICGAYMLLMDSPYSPSIHFLCNNCHNKHPLYYRLLLIQREWLCDYCYAKVVYNCPIEETCIACDHKAVLRQRGEYVEEAKAPFEVCSLQEI